MKDKFGGFYGPTEQEIDEAYKDAGTLFVFDTNILLSLYRCEESTRRQFLEVWGNLKEQVWIPFHVCLEYQRNRLAVVQNARTSLKDINKSLSTKLDKMFTELNSDTLSRYSNLRSELETLKTRLKKTLSDFNKSNLEARRSSIDFVNSHDDLRDRIDELTEGRIGSEPNQDAINKINTAGAIRYKYRTGPGFADAPKKGNDRFSFNGINYDAQYSDLYIWMQIIDEAKEKEIKKIIYITNDEKEDFYYQINNQNRGPIESLVTEMKREANVDIFLMHQIDSFLHHAVKSLDAKIDEPSIIELAASAAVAATPVISNAIGGAILGATANTFYSAMLSKIKTAKNSHIDIDDLISEHENIQNKILLAKNEINNLDLQLDDDSISLEEKQSICRVRNKLQSEATFLDARLDVIKDYIKKNLDDL